jgi:hypothetical protein
MQEQVPREQKRFELPDMTHEEMDGLLHSQVLSRVTFNDKPYPYTIPVEYYYLGDVMYFHLTSHGKKMDLWRKDPNVTVEVDWHNHDLSDYKSVILKGKLVEVVDADEKNIVRVAMADAVKDKLGVKALFKIPWGKKGVDYLSDPKIPLMLLKLDKKEMTGKKAFI